MPDMKTTPTPKSLSKWCADRRGRFTALAEILGKSRQFVQQMSTSERPIPHDTGRLLAPAMRIVESNEKKAFEADRKRVHAGRSA